ncbi:hypothetical protein [Gymnodinialimonas hymeniacidonis]|uniref:hypothetical protein n=1 Tax=Gymnodinialimonas hymeniacidonis TaxID=3126508 RepID=UPI0034C5D390
MIRRILFLSLTALLGLWFYYISRFWDFRLWDRDGLFGIEALRPQGGLLARWLRGTDFAPYELLIWVVAFFLALSILQKIFDFFTPTEEPHDDG